MAEIIRDGLACVDCAMAIASGDLSAMDDQQQLEWAAGVADVDACDGGRLYAVVASDGPVREFSSVTCCNCGNVSVGVRYDVVYMD